jgi:hypothetical protein
VHGQEVYNTPVIFIVDIIERSGSLGLIKLKVKAKEM